MITLIFIFILVILIYFSIKTQNLNLETFKNINNDNKKIAFCFLIYEEIYHEDLWNDYFKNIDSSKYNIYIHYKNNKPLKYFEKYKLKNTIETCWGCLSLVHAQNLLLKEALKDKNNTHFIWLSDSCIPLKSFNYVLNYLEPNKSYFNKSPDSQVFPRGNPATKFINKNNIKKTAMQSIICSKHARLFVDNTKNIDIWFKDVKIPDEIVYITLIHHNNLQNEIIITPNLASDAVIFTAWSDMSNYKLFSNSKLIKNTPNTYKYICPEELKYLIKSKSLFARKFDKQCKGLENLIDKLN